MLSSQLRSQGVYIDHVIIRFETVFHQNSLSFDASRKVTICKFSGDLKKNAHQTSKISFWETERVSQAPIDQYLKAKQFRYCWPILQVSKTLGIVGVLKWNLPFVVKKDVLSNSACVHICFHQNKFSARSIHPAANHDAATFTSPVFITIKGDLTYLKFLFYPSQMYWFIKSPRTDQFTNHSN